MASLRITKFENGVKVCEVMAPMPNGERRYYVGLGPKGLAGAIERIRLDALFIRQKIRARETV